MKKLVLLIALASLYFVTLYQFDNKYNLQTSQPANGILTLTSEELLHHPLRYLCNGWAFYPDVLLSPNDFINGAPNLYMNYVTIGEYMHFDRMKTRSNPHGCGTYVLNLYLPKEINTYALDLPEIFSAYRLYIDDTLVLEMGNPDAVGYKAATQNRLITFEQSGKVTLILAVSDYSHFYSGLIYPPAFGTPYTLMHTQSLRLAICIFCDTVALLAAILALYLGIRMKHHNACIFSFLSLAMLGFTSYTIFNLFFALPIMPWYTLEITCGYLISFLIIVLHNRICQTSVRLKKISNSVSFAFVILSCLFGLSSPYLTVPLLTWFSNLVFVYKMLVAIFLITTAYYSMKKYDADNKPLFYGAVLYGVSFVWDRLLPIYEPIYSGWFSEWGSLILVFAIGYTLWRNVIRAYAYSLSFAEEHRQISRQLDMQLAYTKQLTQLSEETRRLTHDFRQHLRTLGALATQNDDQQILSYLQQATNLFTPTASTAHISFSENPALDALLRYYHSVACENNIEADFKIGFLQPLPLTDIELCTILGNLLENAIEACNRQLEGPKKIQLTTKETSQNTFILIENTYDGKVIQKNKHFISQKTPDHTRIGIGLESVRDILTHHHATLDISPKTHTFSIGICLPINKTSNTGLSPQ